MKILWVKAGGLVPPDTVGNIRSYKILRQIARRHSVTFFSFHDADANHAHSELANLFDRVVCLPLTLPAPKSLRELGAYCIHAFSRQPYNISKYCRREVRTELRQLLQRESFDVIVCDFLIAAGVIPWGLPLPKVLFTHNVESAIWQRHYEVTRNPLWKAVSWREWRTMEAAEQNYLRRADHVLTVSEEDGQSFRRYVDAAKLSVIPTGVDTEYFKPSSEPVTPNSIVFTGSMDWLPNEDGIAFFVEEILPLIRQQIPDVSLCVVGRNPSPQLKELAAKKRNVQVTGSVEDVRPFLASGAVCVVPLRIGGGTRLKIFEAMAMGKAVVSTAVGAEGLPVEHGKHLIIADDPASFARSVVDLLRDKEKRQPLELAGRRLVEASYSWDRVAAVFSDVLTEAVTRSRARSAQK